jgi:hypothetical protein
MIVFVAASGHGQAALAFSDQRNGCPERQMLCRITESFLASATRALPAPDRLAIACAQSFNPTKRVIDEPPIVRITGRHRPDRGTIGRSSANRDYRVSIHGPGAKPTMKP